MKNRSRIYKSLVTGAGIVISGATLLTPALAVTPSPTSTVSPTTPSGTIKPTVTKKSTETAKQKCDRITQKVTEVKLQLQNQSDDKPVLFNGIIKRNEEFITQLKSEGYDTTKLEADLTKLKDLIKVRSALRLSLAFAALDKVKDIQCGKIKKEDIKSVFDSKKQEYENAKSKFQEDVKDILALLRDDLASIRDQRQIKRQENKVNPSGTIKASGTTKPSPSRDISSKGRGSSELTNVLTSISPTRKDDSNKGKGSGSNPSKTPTVSITSTFKPTVTEFENEDHSGHSED